LESGVKGGGETAGFVDLTVAAPGAGSRLAWTPEELVAAAACGDDAAFEEVVRRYQRRVYGFACRYVADREEANDLAQEIFVRLFSNLNRFDSKRRFEPWFWQLAANASLNYRRKRVVRPYDHDELPEPEVQPPPALPEESAFGHALSRLSPQQRLPLLLHYHAGLPLGEIAALLKLRVPALKSRLHRTRVELRRALAGER
jgi:RNA polymerase sigma-70 factor (ECF subfamily)